MRSIILCLAGCLALVSCADADPVDETKPTPVPSASMPANVVDRRLPSPGESAAPQSDGEFATGQWFSKTERGVPMAMFGPPESEALFSVRCEGGELVFTRSVKAPGGPVTMDLTADGETRTIAATGRQDPLPRVTGTLLARDPFAEILASTNQPIAVRIGDDAPLRIPPHEHLREIAGTCGA